MHFVVWVVVFYMWCMSTSLCFEMMIFAGVPTLSRFFCKEILRQGPRNPEIHGSTGTSPNQRWKVLFPEIGFWRQS